MRKSSSLFVRKPIAKLLEEVKGEDRLHRVLGPIGLTSLGIGAIIGTGIFVLTGLAANETAGPALMLSFVVSGIACIFAALCYAEFASTVPVAGSAYTYAYATVGELLAWIVGWDLVLEYTVAAAAVANSWSGYFQDLISVWGFKIPAIFARSPFDYNEVGKLYWTGSVVNLPSVLLAVILTAVLVRGIKESTTFNSVLVVIKVSVVLFVIAVGAYYVIPENWTPFAPYGYSGLGFFGKTVMGQESPSGAPVGMLAGAAIVFFAYIGFDSISTHVEEAKNPGRDVPVSIIASLVVCTILYIAVAAVLTGMVPYNQLDIHAPVSNAFAQVGLPWAQALVSVGALTGMTSVMLVAMLSQPRILLAMARDGLLPQRFFGAIHDRFRTPWKSTILTGFIVALLAGVLPLRVLAELVNIGTLLAFVLVCAAVLILRRTHPEIERPFRVPFGPLLPILGIGSCLMLMFALPAENWLRLFGWLAIGFVIYWFYGRTHSAMRRSTDPSPPDSI